MHVVHIVLQRVEPRLDGVWHLLLDRLCGGRAGRNLGSRERISVDECVPRCSSFDLAQADKVAALEVAISMLKLPER